MKALKAAGALALLLLVAAGSYFWGLSSQEARSVDAQKQEELERRFQDSMSGATLEGSFTVDGSTETHPERYTIEKVSKLRGDYWVFDARIQYGERDLTLPVPVRVVWAEDTPVVSLTDAAIPGLGTFTARVLFYEDHYAGMWRHGDRGGEQCGKIVRAAP